MKLLDCALGLTALILPCAGLASAQFERQPLEDPEVLLPAGVHLHWALPDGLTRSHPVSADPAKPQNKNIFRAVFFLIKHYGTIHSLTRHKAFAICGLVTCLHFCKVQVGIIL